MPSEKVTALLSACEELIDEKLAAQPRAMGAIPGIESPPRIPGFAGEAHKFSLMRAAQVALHENPRQLERTHGFEMEAMRAQRDAYSDDSLVMKTLSAATGASGGFIVPSEVSQELLTAVIEQSILGKIGVRRVTASSGELILNRASNVTAYYVDTEAFQAITESDMTLSQVSLRPRALACLSSLSYQMAVLSDPAVESVLRMQMAKRIAQVVDKDAFLGSGASAEPRGLFNNAQVASRTISFSGLKLGPTATGANGLLPKLRAMINLIRTDNALTGPLAWFGEPKTALAPEIACDTTGMPLFVEKDKSAVGTLLGYPFGVTSSLTNATTTAMRFGIMDPSQMLLVNWGALAFATSNSATATSFSTGVTHLRAISLWDTAILEPLSVALGTAYSAADCVNS